MELQTSLALLNMPKGPVGGRQADLHGREPFSHPVLDGLRNLSPKTKEDLVGKTRLAGLAREYGFEPIIRWKPKKVSGLQATNRSWPRLTESLATRRIIFKDLA